MTYWLISHRNEQSRNFPLACWPWHGCLYGIVHSGYLFPFCLKNWDPPQKPVLGGNCEMLMTGWIQIEYLAVMKMKQHFSEIISSLCSSWKSQQNLGAIRKDIENKTKDVIFLLPTPLMYLNWCVHLTPLCPSWVWSYRELIWLKKWSIYLRKRN